MTAPTADEARRELDWLKVVGALRSIEVDEAGEFVIETRDRQLLALPADAVEAFKRGVLCGWRLPRGEAPR